MVQKGVAMRVMQSKLNRPRRWGAVPAVLVLSVSLLSLDAVVAAAAPPAPSRASAHSHFQHYVPTDGFTKGIIFTSGGHQLKKHGVTWMLSVFAAEGSTGTASISVELFRTITKTSFELHEWDVANAPASSITSISASKWRIHPADRATLPLMAMNLVFKKTKTIPVACQTGHETEYRGTLSGTVYLATGLSHLGTLGSKTTRISFSLPNIATVYNGCVLKHAPPVPCTKGYSAFIAGTAAPYPAALASSSGAGDYLSISQTIPLAKPTGARRFDFISAREPAITRNGSVFAVRTSGSPIKGSVALNVAGLTPLSSTASCTLDRKLFTETSLDYNGASVSDHALTGKLLATGSITLGKHTFGAVTVSSYK